MTIIDTVRLEMQEHHEKHGSWRAVGRIIGKSAAYAQRVVRGDLEPSQEVIARWIASRSCVPVKHEQIAYPVDHNAILHLSPNGTGSLHTYTVPPDAEVVIVPAGARIVQPKAPAPKRRRVRLDVTRYAHVLTPDMMIRVLDEAAADVQVSEAPPAWVTAAADNLARLRDGR